MEFIDLTAILQTVSSALVLLSMFFAKTLWTRQREMEKTQIKDRLESDQRIAQHRLELEREIMQIRRETEVAIAKMGNAA